MFGWTLGGRVQDEVLPIWQTPPHHPARRWPELVDDLLEEPDHLPKTAKELALLGESRVFRGEYRKALEAFNQCVALCPGEIRYGRLRVLAFWLLRDDDKAILETNKLLKKNPECFVLYDDLARIHMSRRRPIDVLKTLLQAREAGDRTSYREYCILVYKLHFGKVTNARSQLTKIIWEDPGRASPVLTRASLHARAGNFRKAHKDLKRYLGAGGNIQLYHTCRIEACRMARDWDRALRCADLAFDELPEEDCGLLTLLNARIFITRGEFEAAKEELIYEIEFNVPSHTSHKAYEYMALVLIETGKFKAVSRLLSDYGKREDWTPGMLFMSAISKGMTGQESKAVRDLHAALRGFTHEENATTPEAWVTDEQFAFLLSSRTLEKVIAIATRAGDALTSHILQKALKTGKFPRFYSIPPELN